MSGRPFFITKKIERYVMTLQEKIDAIVAAAADGVGACGEL